MKATLISRLKRLGRMERAREKQTDTVEREAVIVIGFCEGERHLEMTSSGGGRCWFEERPGPGPQISDFGKFKSVSWGLPLEQ